MNIEIDLSEAEIILRSINGQELNQAEKREIFDFSCYLKLNIESNKEPTHDTFRASQGSRT